MMIKDLIKEKDGFINLTDISKLFKKETKDITRTKIFLDFFEPLHSCKFSVKNAKNMGLWVTKGARRNKEVWVENTLGYYIIYSLFDVANKNLFIKDNITNLANHEIKDIQKVEIQGFLYLMLDKNTKYTKIGFSQYTKYSEKTLQSEKPTIEMICFYGGTMEDEKTLHEKFIKKRIRGEWFNLTSKDTQFIKNYFNN
jgi:hypothetical protein